MIKEFSLQAHDVHHLTLGSYDSISYFNKIILGIHPLSNSTKTLATTYVVPIKH